MYFNHLNYPDAWRAEYSKYPNGLSILESLMQWIRQVDDMVDSHNANQTTINGFDERLDLFIAQYDTHLQSTLTETLMAWQASGFLDELIDAALQTELDTLSLQLAKTATKDELSQVASPLVAITAAQMTDTTRVYVYTGTEGGYTPGNWYYHDGTTWSSGGLYQATGLPDNSITPLKLDADLFDKINLLDKNFKMTPYALYDRMTKNLFNKETVTAGYYLINGVPTVSGANRFSDYIRVTPGSVLRGTAFITSDGGAFYDRKLNFISKIIADTTTQITIPAGVYWMRINISSAANLDRYMLNVGDTLLPYEPYGVGIVDGLLSYTDNLFGKKILTIGDSITWLDGQTAAINDVVTNMIGYQEQFRKVGAIVTNKGNSGATYREYDATISNMEHGSLYTDIVTNAYDVSAYDIITLFAGTNDVARGFNLGSLGNVDDSVFDPKTTLGALRGIIEYIRAHNPDCDIYILTPTMSSLVSRPYADMLSVTNGIIDVANMYGIPCMDLLRNSGIGKGNFDNYLYDGLHPNNVGFEYLGKRLVRFINSN